jgi:DNA-binding transcriptional LysR family regulator
MDRLKSMEVFVAIVAHGSLAAAARKYDMTAPMAGKHLHALERRLGVRLVQRTTRRHTLTEAGRQYFERCMPGTGTRHRSSRRSWLSF